MPGKVRASVLVLLTAALLTLVVLGRPVHAAPVSQSQFPDKVEISGPLHLVATVSSPVAVPGDSVRLDINLENQSENARAPRVSIVLPPNLESHDARLPTGTTANFRDRIINWLPLLPPGEARQLSLEFTAKVAEVSHPIHEILIELSPDSNRAEISPETAILQVWTGLPPTAAVSAQPVIVAVGEPVMLQAITGGSGPFTQSWDLGDGRLLSAENPTVAYASPGIYEVTLRLENPLETAMAVGTVTVVPQPSAAFSTLDGRPEVGQMVGFTNESGGQPPLAFSWDFGDGEISWEFEPTHQYKAPGEYLVRLTVESEYGKAEDSLVLVVGAPPTADIVLDENIEAGEALHGQAYFDDTVETVQWDMGDGTHYDSPAISHSYLAAGDMLVVFTASNTFGETQVARWVRVTSSIEPGNFVYLPLTTVRQAGGSDAPVDSAPVEAAIVDSGGNPAPAEPAPTAEPVVETVVGDNAPPTEMTPPPVQEPPPPATAAEAPSVAASPQPEVEEDASPAESLLWYINEARRLHGLPPLVYNYELSIAAQQHTADMSRNPDMLHQGSDGSLPPERQQRYGYRGAYAGEAVAWGFEQASAAVEYWVNSPPHRLLILSPNATEVGVGFVADGSARDLWYWAAEFGIRLEAPPLITNEPE